MNRTPPTAAETAYNRKEYGQAEALFRGALANDPSDDAAHEGLMRTLLDQDRVAEATAEAESWLKSGPQDSMALVAVGDAQLRGGDPTTAFGTYSKAAALDPCNARAYYGRARVQRLAGMHASSQPHRRAGAVSAFDAHRLPGQPGYVRVSAPQVEDQCRELHACGIDPRYGA